MCRKITSIASLGGTFAGNTADDRIRIRTIKFVAIIVPKFIDPTRITSFTIQTDVTLFIERDTTFQNGSIITNRLLIRTQILQTQL